MMNRVVLVGRLTKDPDLRYTPNGVPVATFTLAVNRPFSKEKESDFINCVVWKKTAENVANFLKKGSLAGVDGRIQTRNYEGQDGKKVYVTEVLAESVQFLEPKGEKKQDNKSASMKGLMTTDEEDPFNGNGQIDISDDDMGDLPF
jgi:single-strand DNA-binding protein